MSPLLSDRGAIPNTQQEIKQEIKRTVHHEQLGLFAGMQSWFNIPKSVNVILHINRNKPQDHLNRDTKSI